MTKVVPTETFQDWFNDLSEDEAKAVTRTVELLKAKGVTLPEPYSKRIKGTKYALFELRTKTKGQPLRVLYIFDELRQAVLLVGGNKKGENERLFYKTMIARAEKEWKRYLAE
jgi:hypothetical protein